MLEPDLIELFVRPLERLQFKYLISGSVAAMLYGEPRVTHDIDFIILLRTQDIVLLTEAYPAPDFYVPPREVITSEVMREGRGQFNVIHSASALKADFHTAKRDELQLWAFRNGRNYLFGETPVRLRRPNTSSSASWRTFAKGVQRNTCVTSGLCSKCLETR